MYSLQLIVTEDGSHSLYVPEINETYHSVHGAVTESKYVFIKNGFRHLLSTRNPEMIRILEIGLGTGLNALLTQIENRKFSRVINYVALEPMPAPAPVIRQLNYKEMAGAGCGGIFDLIHNSAWNEGVMLDDFFCLHKINIKYQNYIPGIEQFDLIYYDAFAPGKQPEMWDLNLLCKTADCLTPSGMLVTYTAKGQVKRDLKTAGLTVETLQGPPGKKEMIRAVRK